jgi:hypothetical protein
MLAADAFDARFTLKMLAATEVISVSVITLVWLCYSSYQGDLPTQKNLNLSFRKKS